MIVPKLFIALSLGAVFGADFDNSWNEHGRVESSSSAHTKGTPVCAAVSENAINEEDDFKSVTEFFEEEVAHPGPTTNVNGSDVIDESIDYWEREGLPAKEAGDEDSIESAEEVDSNWLTVHDKTYSFEELRRMICSSADNDEDVTASITGEIERLKISELLSMMIDVVDHDNFRLFLQQTAAYLPYPFRVSFLKLLNKRFVKTTNVETIKELEKFLEILSLFPVSANDQHAYYNIISTSQESFCINIKHFLKWEMEQFRTRVFRKIDSLIAEKKLEDVVPVLSKWSGTSWYFILHLLERQRFSASRFALVDLALKRGAIEVGAKSPAGDHVLFNLVSSSRNCNDIIKAFLLQPDCNLSVVNNQGKSLHNVARTNKDLSAKDRKIMQQLLESKSRSRNALDKILPIA